MASQDIFRALARVARNAGLVLVGLFLASQASASVTLAWDPVADATGYYVYYGPMSGGYAGKIDVGNVTTFTVSGLADEATYYFAASGYDGAGVEGRLSNEAIAYGVPMADFSASATSGAAPLAINLTNSSVGPIATYAWNFGDGTSSGVKNPSHVYSSPGVYSVALTVTGAGGSDTEVKTNLVTVNATGALLAQFTSSATSGLAPFDVAFTSTSTGTIAAYAWSFGDGTTSTLANPGHTYAVAGNYTVTLTVTGAAGSNGVARMNYVKVRRHAP